MASIRNERFFLFGFYGQDNVGDDLLLQATIAGVRGVCANASFVVRNGGPIKGIESYGDEVVLTGVDRILSDQSRSKLARGVEALKSYRRHFRTCGWLIFGGGTVFHDRSSALPLAFTVLICAMARMMGLRVVAIGVGISKLRSAAGKVLLRSIIQMSDLFAVRDEQAFEECIKVGVSHRVERTADLAFALSHVLTETYRHSVNKAKPTVGFSIYPPVFLDPAHGPARLDVFRRVLSTFLARGWAVSLLAFHGDPAASETKHDRGIFDKVTQAIPAELKSGIRFYALTADRKTLAEVYGDLDLHCGMRFHGHVLAAIFGLPFVGIAIDNKINGICEFFEMPVVELKDFSEQAVIASIDKALRYAIDRQQDEKVIAKAMRNFSLLSELHESRASADRHATTGPSRG